MYRIGIGYDLHRLVERRKLILGGVLLPSKVGLLGHSDADVLAHAVCDALLGACAQKDIGEHFPASHAAYKDISSMQLLKKVNSILKKQKYSVRNIDSIVVAEKPNLSKYKVKMRREIARSLGLAVKQVSVKAKTAEGLGPVGKGKAISAYAVALISK
jgi:2-C-methyl-D-erythritol 2,4-cyclodiphosphate synthase